MLLSVAVIVMRIFQRRLSSEYGFVGKGGIKRHWPSYSPSPSERGRASAEDTDVDGWEVLVVEADTAHVQPLVA
jgi:hypothetical protein